jgi:hypothetical protein
MVRPAALCSTLGRLDFMRVPLPAAMMIAVVFIEFVAIMLIHLPFLNMMAGVDLSICN